MSKGRSASLLNAVGEGDFARVRQYISAGIDPLYCDGNGANALRRLGTSPGYVEIFDELVAAGCDMHCIDSDGRNLFARVGILGHEICERLIKGGLDVNSRDPRGLAPLHWVVRDPKSVLMLIGAGAEVDASAKTGMTPLLRAAYNNHVESFQILLAHGADMRVVSNEGATVLHAAAGKGSSDIIRVALERGLEVNALDSEMKTPLHAAARSGHTHVCKLLVDAGADSAFTVPSHPKGYLTPFQEAVYAGHISTVSFFHDYCGEQPYQKTPSGMRIMALARNRPEMRDFLGRLRDEIALRAVVSAAAGAPTTQRSASSGMSPL